jgi:hypothetical protein
LRSEWFLLLAALSLKMAARDAKNSFLGLAKGKKLGTLDVRELFPSERNFSDHLGLAPPISSDPQPISGSSKPELQAKNFTPC